MFFFRAVCSTGVGLLSPGFGKSLWVLAEGSCCAGVISLETCFVSVRSETKKYIFMKLTYIYREMCNAVLLEGDTYTTS